MMWTIHLVLVLAAAPCQARAATSTAQTGPQVVRSESNAAQPTAAQRPPTPGLVVIDPGTARQWRGERISLSTRDADLVEVLRSFARLADVNLVVDPSIRGAVTVELHDVPWDQALWVILKTHGLGAEIDGRLLAVHPSSAPR